jgi:hypothetical protein
LHIWSTGAWVQRIQNRPFLFVNDMYSEVLQVYRFDPFTNGEIAIPSVLFAKSHLQKEVGWPPYQPQKGEWIWRDRDGDGAFDDGEFVTDDGRDAPSLWGWSVDSDGNVWQASHDAGIRKFTCRGLDDRGNPIYEFSSMTSFPMPQPFTRLERVTYIPATDTLYLAGYTAERPHHDGLWKVMGRVLCRYDHRSKGNPAPRWQVTPDYTADGSWKGKPASMTVAGDYVFVVYVVGGRIEVFNADAGAPVGYLKPGPEVGGALPGDAVGWVDIPRRDQSLSPRHGRIPPLCGGGLEVQNPDVSVDTGWAIEFVFGDGASWSLGARRNSSCPGFAQGSGISARWSRPVEYRTPRHKRA